jgi:hypothetical protein
MEVVRADGQLRTCPDVSVRRVSGADGQDTPLRGVRCPPVRPLGSALQALQRYTGTKIETEMTETRFTKNLSSELRVELTLGEGRIDCHWLPDFPGRPLTPRELKRYRQVRQEAVTELMRRAGLSGRAAVIEIGDLG